MRLAREGAAKRLCHGCPARQECFNGALARREEHGIWGGHSFPYDPAREAAASARRTERAIAKAVRRRRAAAPDSAVITPAQEARAS